MEPLLVFPDPPPAWLSSALDGAGYPWLAVASTAAAARHEPEDGWTGAVVAAEEDVDGSLAACLAFCRSLRKREDPLRPLLLAVPRAELAELDFREDLFDDFVLFGSSVAEMDARLSHLFRRTGRGKQHDLIIYGPLALNLETYQAALGGRPLDLTFMEYELLRFLAAHPGKVFTREVLLSRVWGYEYYGGARTVDVMNYANDIDLFHQWAEALIHGRFSVPVERRYNAASIFKRAQGQGKITHIAGLSRLLSDYDEWVCAIDLLPIGAPRRDWLMTLISDGMVIVRHPNLDSCIEIADRFATELQLYTY